MKTHKEYLEEFNRSGDFSEPYVNVTKNGEISFDTKTKEFVVWDEIYVYEVGRTHYPLCALAILETYAKEYVG